MPAIQSNAPPPTPAAEQMKSSCLTSPPPATTVKLCSMPFLILHAPSLFHSLLVEVFASSATLPPYSTPAPTRLLSIPPRSVILSSFVRLPVNSAPRRLLLRLMRDEAVRASKSSFPAVVSLPDATLCNGRRKPPLAARERSC